LRGRAGLLIAAAVLVVSACNRGAQSSPPTAARTLQISGHAASEMGQGSTAVVLVHGASTHKDSWFPLMPALAGAGYDAVALDLGTDRAAAVQAAVTYVRAHGAKQVVLMGSSLGAADVLEAAADGDYAAVVTFSAVSTHTTDEPVYAIASRNDPTADTVSIANEIVAGSGAHSARLVVEGGTHGVALVPGHPEAVTLLLRWLRAVLGH
jgi:acetyl esterase/lipase